MVTATRDEIDVKTLNTPELLELFLRLETPAVDEMNGEYAATTLRMDSLLARTSFLSFSNPFWPGMWKAKGFRPIDLTVGRGYNLFMRLGKPVQRFPMLTRIAPSRYDGKPSYHLVYDAYRSVCGAVHMVDEIRRLKPGEYLGFGTCGVIEAQRRIVYPFLLNGPIASYRGDGYSKLADVKESKG